MIETVCQRLNIKRQYGLGLSVLLFFILLLNTTSKAQNRSDSIVLEYSLLNPPKKLINDLSGNMVYLIQSPFQKWDRKKWIYSSLFLGGSTVSYLMLDESVASFMKNKQSTTWKHFNTVFSEIGEPFLIGSLVIGIEVLGHLSKNNRFNKIAVLSAQSLLISMSGCYATKLLSGRVRPSHTDDSRLWYGPSWNEPSKTSFFSGHTTAIFTITTVAAMEFEHVKWLPPTLYGIAGLSSISRIAMGEHWTSDVVFAGFFAHLVARSVVNRERAIKQRFSFYPIVSPNGSQAGFAVQF